MAKLFTFLSLIMFLCLIGFLVFSLIKALIRKIDKDVEITVNKLQDDYEKRKESCTCDSTCEVGPDTKQ